MVRGRRPWLSVSVSGRSRDRSCRHGWGRIGRMDGSVDGVVLAMTAIGTSLVSTFGSSGLPWSWP